MFLYVTNALVPRKEKFEHALADTRGCVQVVCFCPSSKGLGLPEALVLSDLLVRQQTLTHDNLQSNFVVNPMLDRAALRALEEANAKREEPAILELSEQEVAWHDARRRESIGALGIQAGLFTAEEVAETRKAQRRGSAVFIEGEANVV